MTGQFEAEERLSCLLDLRGKERILKDALGARARWFGLEIVSICLTCMIKALSDLTLVEILTRTLGF